MATPAFKSQANQAGAFPYQTQINQALRSLLGKWRGVGQPTTDIEELKSELLNDPVFVKALAAEMNKKHASK